jgi:hypothetical protein
MLGIVFRRRARATARQVRRAAKLLADALTALGDRLSYRRQELVAVGLLAASVLGGFAVETWRTRTPALFERLEAEPPRPGGAALTGPRGARRGFGAVRFPLTPTPQAPLDLNLATELDLIELPGIGPRLAARIVMRRNALGGRFESPQDLERVPGIGRARLAALRPLVTVKTPGRDRTPGFDQTHEPP